jgi:ABC-type Mn2+/Zn2+ transport system permease subunit
MNASLLYALLLALLFALAAGLIGCFALMKRMLLASDVISHLALPGLGAAFLFRVNPLAGGAATLFLGTLLIWQLQKKTGLAADAAIGVVFAAALAIGAAITPREDLVQALFGSFQQLSLAGFLLGFAAVVFVVVFIALIQDQLTLALFSPEMAAATGVNVRRTDLYFLLAFSLTVLVGLRYMGALLSSTLIIIPAATARQFTDRVSRFLFVSAAVSLLSVSIGFALGMLVFKTSTPGPITVIVAIAFFCLSLLRKAR